MKEVTRRNAFKIDRCHDSISLHGYRRPRMETFGDKLSKDVPAANETELETFDFGQVATEVTSILEARRF